VCGTGSNSFNLCVSDACNIPVNGNFCVDVTVSMFTNVTGLQFILSYPAASLDFVSFTSPALGAPFQLNEFADGNLRAIYVDGDQSGESLDDGAVITTICFTNEITGTTNIEVASVQVGDTDGMVPGAIGNDGSVNGSGCNGNMTTCIDGIQNGNETGVDCGGPDCQPCVAEECGAGSSQFNLCVEDACDIAVNGNVCIDLTVSNFTNITGLQFRLGYPAANLDFTSFTSPSALGSELQVNQSADGDVRAIYVDSDQSGESLDDGTVIATICFTNETAGTTVIEVVSLQVGNTGGMIVGPIGNDGTVNAAGCSGSAPTCTDRIQNGQETGVDCGGPDCQPCVAEECGAGSSQFNLCVEDACDIAVNGNVCLDLTVSNFTNITGLQFRLAYPAANLEFTGFTSPSALGSELQVNQNADGDIRAIYIDSDQSGESLDDGTVIATICFTNETTGATVIDVASLQVGNTGGMVVEPISNDGSVNPTDCNGSVPTCIDGIRNGNEAGVDCGGPDCAPCDSTATCSMDSDAFTICVGEACNIAQNEQACVDLFAGNFTDIVGFQMDIFYPGANLEFQSLTSTVLGSEIQGNDFSDGNIRVVFFNADLNGITVEDGTSIATICFTNEAAGTTVLNANNLRGSNTSGMFDTPAPVANDGMVNGCSTNPSPSCTNGIRDGNEEGIDCGGDCPTTCPTSLQPRFSVGSGVAAVGGEVCINVSVRDFTNLASIMMTLNYDATSLQFVSITGNPALPAFGPSNFNTNPSGSIAINYTAPSPQTLTDGQEFFTVCFTLLGGPPTNVTLTDISVTNSEGNSLTTTTNSGTISETVSFENFTLVAGSTSGPQGTEVCIDVNVFNLVDLAGLQFAIGYDAEKLSFVSGTGTGALAGLQISNPNPGILRAIWFDPNVGSNSVPDGNSIATACFTVLQACETTVSITEDLPQFRIRATDANNQSVNPIDRVNGTVNTGATNCDGGGPPPNLVLQLSSNSGPSGAEVCINLPVTNFINLTNLSFSLTYDPTKVTFQRVTNFGLASISEADVSSPSLGRVRFEWNSPNSTGESIPDGNSVASFCFIVDQLSVAPVNFGNNPIAILARNGNDQAVGVIPNGGVINSDMLAIVSSVLSNPICAGASDGSISLNVSGGSGLSYQWSPNVSISESATGLSAGTYSVTITNGNSSINEMFTIVDPGPFAIEVASVSGVSCSGEENGQITIITVGDNGPFTFDWSDNLQDGVGVNQQTNLGGGSYSVTVTDRFGCPRILNNIMVGEPMPLNIVGSEFKITRDAPGGVTIEITGGRAPFAYSWTGPNDYTSNAKDIDDVTEPETYCLTVTDNNECTETQCFDVIRDVDITSTVIDQGCVGEDNASIDITVIGGNDTYDYIWSTGGVVIPNANGQDLDNVAPGDYQVMINSGECQTTQTITINAPEPILLPGTVNPATSGNNGTITLTPSGGNPPLTFVWDDGPTIQNRTGVASGQYCVTAMDGSGCTASMCYTVAAEETSILSVSTAPTSCRDTDDGTVVILINNGVAPFNVQVAPLGSMETFADGNISLELAGGTYTIFITDAQGAMLDTMLTITTPDAITATATVTSDTEAAGCSGRINFNIEGGTGPYIVAWSDGMTGATRNLLCAGDYTPTITDDNGCTFEPGTVTVGRIDEELVAATDVACAGGTEGGIDVSITGGVLPYTFAWTRISAPDVISTNEDLVVSDVTGGVTAGDYTLTITDATGAMLVMNYTVGISAGFSTTVAVTSNYNGFGVSCAESTDGRVEIVISGQGDFMYEYLLDGAMVGVDSVLSNAAAGTYAATVIDAGGCEITQMVEVTAPPALVLSADIDNISCGSTNDGSIFVEATGGIITSYAYSWSTGAMTPRISGLGTGTYDVTVTDDNNCTSTESYSLVAPEDLAVTFEAIEATDGCNGSIRIIPLGGSGNYQFTFPQLPNQGDDPFAEGLCPGVYTIQVTDDNECQTVTMIAEVLDRRFPCLSAREVITPNGDGLNEAFVITCSDGREAINNSLQVFNRWGQIVYRAVDYDCSDDNSGINCFEGETNDGSLLPNGPYYYVFEFRNMLGEEMQQRGSLTILRD
jgi:hypothetical protein